MKKILISFVFLFLVITGFSSHWVEIRSSIPTPARISLISSDISHSVVHFSLNGFNMKEVETSRGSASIITLEGLTPIQESGTPDLPKMTTSLIIPDLAGMSCRVLSSSYRDFENITIAPSKGVISRDQDPASLPYIYGKVYESDQFFPGNLTDTRDPYIIRDLRGQTMIANPFQYNPLRKTLRVYYDLTVELYKTTETGVNPFYRKDQDLKINASFRPVYSHQFLNFNRAAYTPLGEYGRILVISYGPFTEAAQPYVEWKNATGYPTEMIDVATIGTTAGEIKTYIADYYNEKGVSFVLLVGDSPQIPTNVGGSLGGPSDNAYGYITGNDHYPEVYIGRFSAENISQVQTQVQRTIDYELNPQAVEDWLTTVIGIASDQGGGGAGDENEKDFEHIRGLQSKLLNYTYTWNPELFDGSQGGNDEPGNPTPTKVSAAVNDGGSLIVYCGHGSQTSWGTSGFSNSNVNNLTNQGKLPFIWSVACVNGQFNNGTCFAEAWLRASKDGQPTGAVAFLGSTINQSWDSPMEGQDEMVAILSEQYPDNIKRTFGGLSMNGCMKMMDAYGADGRNMSDTWTIFGDPSLMVRTANPDTLLVTHNTPIYVGSTTLNVNCNLEGARVTASMGDTVLSTGLVVDGFFELTFPALPSDGDTLHLVVTAYNNFPYLSDIPVIEALPVTTLFFVSDSSIIKGETVQFTDMSTGGVNSWSWSFPGGNPSASNEQNPVVVYDSVGTYDVQLISANGMFSDTLFHPGYIQVDFPSSIVEQKIGFNCTVVPNPNKGNFALNLAGAEDKLLNLQIFDMVGNPVYQEFQVNINGTLHRNINLTKAPAGIYFLKINGNNSTITRKIIIQK